MKISELPKLPRGLYYAERNSRDYYGIDGIWIKANTTMFEKCTNLVDIYSAGDNWAVDFWMQDRAWVTQPLRTDNFYDAVCWAVSMLWLGEVPYELDEDRIDCRYGGTNE